MLESALGRRHGYELVGRARLTNDALIAASALSLGATIVTGNAADFALLQEYLAVPLASSAALTERIGPG